jgi:hypothetical protein
MSFDTMNQQKKKKNHHKKLIAPRHAALSHRCSLAHEELLLGLH